MAGDGALTVTVLFSVEPDLKAEEFRAVLVASGLGARRPLGDLPRLARMLAPR